MLGNPAVLTESNALDMVTAWKRPVHTRLLEVESLLHQPGNGQNKQMAEAVSLVIGAGGKRLRPVMCLLAGGMLGCEVPEVSAVAAGLEMLHSATLVHDDLIDGADFRRGAETVNSRWSGRMAVMVGDYMFAHAAGLVAQSGSPRVIKLFAETLTIILEGEVSQSLSRWQIDPKVYYRNIYAKTAALFVLGITSVSSLSQARPEYEHALVEYARSAGMAFQIMDDVLDFRGDPQVTGKPSGGDLRQGVITLPVIRYQEVFPDDKDLQNLLQNKTKAGEVVDKLLGKINQSGAVEWSVSEARRLVEEGVSALKGFPGSAYKSGLIDLARYVVNRDH